MEEKDGWLVLGFYEEGSHRLAETASGMSRPLSADYAWLLVDQDLESLVFLWTSLAVEAMDTAEKWGYD